MLHASASRDAAGRLHVSIVNLDPRHMQHGHVQVPGVAADEAFAVRDLLDDVVYQWRGEWNYVRFDPEIRQGHVLLIERA